jgi:hypothetical protein
MLDLGNFTSNFSGYYRLILTMMEMSNLLDAYWFTLDYFSLRTGV